ncbi:MAG TPA: helix-turn-helix transcriptional regulator [Planctomycetaceae bacterium]|nr:helix-turn-helix transcriptional regulator [Planctomycetaceae bacterium]
MPMKTIDLLFEETGLTIEEIAKRTQLSAERIEAIAVGRWTPGPDERQRLATAFGISIEDISWGHTMAPRVVRYHRFGLREGF